MSRAPLDLYATPPEVAARICERLARVLPRPGGIIEPSAGPGRFVTAARAAWLGIDVLAVDVDAAHEKACLDAGAWCFVGDDWQAWAARTAEQRRTADTVRSALILGNPPYNRAQAHCEAALDLLRDGEHLVFLLRLAFLGSDERIAFWERAPLLWVSLVIPRVSFTDGGNDMGEYGVFCWRKGYTGRPAIEPPILWGKSLADHEAVKKQLQLIGGAR